MARAGKVRRYKYTDAAPCPIATCLVSDLLFLSMVFRVRPTPGSLPSMQMSYPTDLAKLPPEVKS